MKEILKIIALKDKHSLAAIRNFPGIIVALSGNEIWIRGIFINDEQDASILKIPAINSYVIGNENKLFPVGHLTPIGVLKNEFDWQPLKKFIKVTMPVAAYSGRLEKKYEIKLTQGNTAKEIYATMITLNEWKKFSKTVSTIRLNKTKFSVSEDGRVLILNSSFISVPGKQFWMHENNLVPIGFDFDPPSLSGLIANRINSEKNCFLFFDQTGNFEKIFSSDFINSSRLNINLLSGSHGI